ncbi:hypothetical protein SS05631_c13990 [Sinorhizobium sp. CCBAU 05631]|nr:hypothetical protein SS05631_c13990 [Sinorhizobium sp. CCBAU 05631]
MGLSMSRLRNRLDMRGVGQAARAARGNPDGFASALGS